MRRSFASRRSLQTTLRLTLTSLAILSATDVFAAQLQSYVATARIRSGNSTLTSDTVSGFASAPVASTGLVEAHGADILPSMPPIDAGAIADFDLPNGTIGVSAGFDAAAHAPIDPRDFSAYGGSSATFFDDVTITSSTLPNGTPVTIRFVYDLAFTTDATSSLSIATAAGDCNSTANGVQGIAPSANRYLSILETATQIGAGLFVAPHQAEFTVPSNVGSTFSFALLCDVDSSGEVKSLGPPGNEINHTASGWMALGLAFGGEVVGADAQLVSGLLGGPFPAASAVGPAASEAALPINAYVLPEPGLSSLLLAGTLASTGLARRRSGRP